MTFIVLQWKKLKNQIFMKPISIAGLLTASFLLSMISGNLMFSYFFFSLFLYVIIVSFAYWLLYRFDWRSRESKNNLNLDKHVLVTMILFFVVMTTGYVVGSEIITLWKIERVYPNEKHLHAILLHWSVFICRMKKIY